MSLPAIPARHKIALALVLGFYLAVGALYSVATPTFEAADELHHYLYVKQVADGAGLPVQTGANPALQEASQPPLYYLVMALPTRWLDTGPLEQTHKLNPHAMKGRPEATENKNMVIHGPEERDWRGPVLTVHVIRWLSLLLGAGTILACFGVARRLAPARPDLALMAAAIIAFLPGFIFIAASVNNDNAIILLGSVALLMALDLVRQQPTIGKLLLFGTVAGLAAISKPSGLAVLPLSAVAIFAAARQHRDRRLLRDGLIALLGPFVLIAGWWFLRSWLLYGDPLGLDTMAGTAGARPAGFGLIDLLAEQEGLRWSFWGVFGGFNVIAERWVYWLYDLLALAGAAGLIVTVVKALRPRLVRRAPQPELVVSASALRGGPCEATAIRTQSLQRAIAALWLALLLAGLVKWSLSTMGSQGRLLYPAIGAVAVALVAGWDALLSRRPRPIALGAAVALLAAMAAYLPFATIMPAYRQPALQPDTSAVIANPLMVNFADRMLLAGYTIDRRAAQVGGSVVVTLQWQTLAAMDADYSSFVHVYSGDGRIAAQSDSYPGGGAYATSALPPKVAVSDRHTVAIPPTAFPGQAQLAAGLYDLRTGEIVPARDGQGRPLAGAVPLGRIELIARADQLPEARKIGANLNDQIELAGATFTDEVAPGNELNGRLLWRLLAPMAQDYVAFIHLVGPQGVVAQVDSEPRGGGYPTSAWRPGDTVADGFTLRLPALAPGQFKLFAGMYRREGAERLPVRRRAWDALVGRISGRSADVDGPNAVLLGAIQVR